MQNAKNRGGGVGGVESESAGMRFQNYHRDVFDNLRRLVMFGLLNKLMIGVVGVLVVVGSVVYMDYEKRNRSNELRNMYIYQDEMLDKNIK